MHYRGLLPRSRLAIRLLSVSIAAAQTTQPRPKPEVPYVPTTDEAVQAMLKLADVKKTDIVSIQDSGCGAVRFVFLSRRVVEHQTRLIVSQPVLVLLHQQHARSVLRSGDCKSQTRPLQVGSEFTLKS
ncbi:MAG: hypothetical protein LAP38_03900 [Acidobacteriia bacterium]|nr:hypothetical protein [Terriglobia bacterium]